MFGQPACSITNDGPGSPSDSRLDRLTKQSTDGLLSTSDSEQETMEVDLDRPKETSIQTTQHGLEKEKCRWKPKDREFPRARNWKYAPIHPSIKNSIFQAQRKWPFFYNQTNILTCRWTVTRHTEWSGEPRTLHQNPYPSPWIRKSWRYCHGMLEGQDSLFFWITWGPLASTPLRYPYSAGSKSSKYLCYRDLQKPSFYPFLVC